MDLETLYSVAAVFTPHIVQRRMALADPARRLVHYTSAETAMKMMRGREVWLRNARLMNDVKEVEHGISMMLRFFSPDLEGTPDVGRKALASALEEVRGGILDRAIDRFNGSMSTIVNRTFVACLSEHDSTEDATGRLSMWRAYGGPAAPVAIVVNTTALRGVTDELGAFSNPVSYWSQEEYFASMAEVPDSVIRNRDLLKSVDEETLVHLLFQMLLASAVCTKHPGFAEEREWRVLHVQNVHPLGKLIHATETIGGYPQPIMKLPLRNIPEAGIVGLDPNELIERVIVGPTRYPAAIADAMVAGMYECGVKEPEARIVTSDIPLRT